MVDLSAIELDDNIEMEILPEDEPYPGMDEGGIYIIGDDEEELEEAPVAHDSNLASTMDEADLRSISIDLVDAIERDKNARSDWWDRYSKGLKLLGLKIEEKQDPWPGAASMFHPIMTEAAIRFQANAITETFPAKGPVMSKIVGKQTPERMARARRMTTDMNFRLTEEMTDFREEQERNYFNLCLAGSAFKKTYFDASRRVAVSEFISADDVIVPYGASSLVDCERITHRYFETKNEYYRRVDSGELLMEDLTSGYIDTSDPQEARDQQVGEDSTDRVTSDDGFTFYEVHCLLDFELSDEDLVLRPYRVTIEESSGKILAIYRNWEEGDDTYRRIEFFTHYKYMPGLGFYGMGIIHLIAGLSEAATLVLRQLVDAGTLSNTAMGYKTRGFRANKGDNSPHTPGEFKDIELTDGSKIADNIYQLKFPEPSNVLYQLLQDVVTEARNLAAVPDMKISEMSAEAPVGTALAVIERSMKVLSAVHSRIHDSMKREIDKIVRIVARHYPEQYEFETGDPSATRSQDYNSGDVGIVPVTNPNASTMAQRVMTNQAALQLSQQAPHVYNTALLHRKMLEALGYDGVEEVIPLDDDMEPIDPVSENAAALSLGKLMAHHHQAHDAHIQVHMNFLQDPTYAQILQTDPEMGKQIGSHLMAHVAEHLGYKYRMEMEQTLGVELPPPGEPLPPDVEVTISRLVAEASSQLLGQHTAQAQAQKAQQTMQDPIYQQRERELGIKEAEVERKRQADQQRHLQAMERLKFDEKEMGLDMQVEVLKAIIDAAQRGEQVNAQQLMERSRQATQLAMAQSRGQGGGEG